MPRPERLWTVWSYKKSRLDACFSLLVPGCFNVWSDAGVLARGLFVPILDSQYYPMACGLTIANSISSFPSAADGMQPAF